VQIDAVVRKHRGDGIYASPAMRPAPGLNQHEATDMNWDHSENDWLELKGNVNERWGNLSDCQLADRVQETYGLTNADDDAQRQFTDWQLRLHEIERAAH
jgi:hypothetical protein